MPLFPHGSFVNSNGNSESWLQRVSENLRHAPANVPVASHLGLPWMTNDTNSAGPGKGHGFGAGSGGTMGDGEGSGAGDGEAGGPYANVASPVTCVYCPEPGYTEEARKAKLEGKMLLRVLVGADGRAQQIQILHWAWVWMNAQKKPFERGGFPPGAMPPSAPYPLGSPSRATSSSFDLAGNDWQAAGLIGQLLTESAKRLQSVLLR